MPRRRGCLLIGLLALAAAAGVRAQEPDDVLVLPPPEIEALEVTGERVDDTDVQDDASAITAFSGADLDRANIVNIESLQFNVPGLHVGQSGQQAIVTLRGVGTENASITGEPGVAFHVDGVNYSQPSAARVAFFDLETLDIKRGPQGLEGGKNSTSGSINLVTRKPHESYEVSGDFLMGNYDRQRARGAINVPLGERAAIRTALYYETRDGFLDNLEASDSQDAFDADDFGLRTHLRLLPSESVEILLSYNYFQQGGVGPQADIAPIVRTFPCLGRPVTSALPEYAACEGAREDADPRSFYANFPSSQDNRFWGWTAKGQWEVPALPLVGETQLVGISGFQDSEIAFAQDFDAVSLRLVEIPYNQQHVYQNTAELQWLGSGMGERLEWQASTYYARERGERALQVDNYVGKPEPIDTTPLQLDQGTENLAFGAALHGTLQLLDSVRLQLGGRWIRDQKRTSLYRYAYNPIDLNQVYVGCEGSLSFDPTGGGQPGLPTPWCSEKFRGRTWGAGFDWRPFGDDHLLYARLDRGYKSGGFRSGQRGTYLPEKIWAYAAGTKSEFFESRLQLNLEGFFYNYQDMQLVVLDGTTVRTENANTRMYGWDLEAKANPVEGLDLGVMLSFLKTEILEYLTLDPADLATYNGNPAHLRYSNGTSAAPSDIAGFNTIRLDERDAAENLTRDGTPQTFARRFCPATPEAVVRGSRRVRCGTVTPFGGLDDFSGNELSRAPRWKITLSGGYEIALGRFGSVTPRVQYTWQDDTYFRVFNRSFDLQEAYHLTDVKLEWRSPEERWDAEIFVQNIEDAAAKQNILVGSRNFGSPPFAWYGPPRFYGARVGFKY